MPNTANGVYAKTLTILEDQMQHEFLAYRKAEVYAQTFENPTLRELACTVSRAHKQRFDRLFNYLSSHA